MDKRGVSAMIGYVLLISAMIIMWFIVFQWLKTYVPKETPECPDGTSLIIESVKCDGVNMELIVKNNGLFDIHGYILRGETETESEGVVVSGEKIDITDGYYFFAGTEENAKLKPKESRQNAEPFGDAEGDEYTISSIELVPLRKQLVGDKEDKTIVVCENAIITKELNEDCKIKIK